MSTSLTRIAFLGLASLPALLFAQELDFDRISVEDGMSNLTVRAIHQDARGFMWFGTGDGLNRYDGYDFKVYKHDPEDPDSLSDSDVFSIHEDRQGEFWVGTRSGGLNRFLKAEERFEHFRHDPDDALSLSHDLVWRILEDHTGAMWVGTMNGLNRFNRQEKTFTRYENDPADPGSLSHNTIWALHEDRAGDLWVGTGQGLDRFDRRTQTFTRYRHDPADPRSLGRGVIYGIQEDPEGRLWIATAEELNRFDRRTQTFTRYRHDPADPKSLSSDRMSSLLIDRAGEVWVGTWGGLNRLNVENGEFARYRHNPADPHSLSNDQIVYTYEDRTGVLWLGTYSGVTKYDRAREQFTTIRQRPGHEPTLSANAISSIYEDRSGLLWVGTFTSGLNRLDRGTPNRPGTIVHYKSDPTDLGSLHSGTVRGIWEDRSGVMWIATLKGLSRFDRTRSRFSTYHPDPKDPHSLGNEAVMAVREDSSGRLWVGTYTGLSRFDRATERFIHYPEDPNDPDRPGNEPFYTIYEDRSTRLWFGTEASGLLRLEGERFVRYRYDPTNRNSLSGDKIAAIYEDSSGFIWVGTRGTGLNRLDPVTEEIIRYRASDGLPDDSVKGILEDDEGNLWLSTSRGLSKFDPKSETFLNYGVDDGVQGNVFSIGSYFRSPSGEMFFGGTEGLNAFFPDRVESDPHEPSVVLTEFQLFNQSVPLKRVDRDSPLERSISETAEIVLSHRQNVFSFEFAALHYANPVKNRYAYRLEGFDREWIVVNSKKRFAQYSNLDPGEYVFRVKGSNRHGLWNEAGTSVRLTVLAPPWKTWWAYSLYGLMLAATVVGYLRSHRKKIERAEKGKHEAKMRETQRLESLGLLAGGVAHDFNNLLAVIIGNAELARNTLADESTALALLDDILEAGEHASDLTSIMLDYVGGVPRKHVLVDLGVLIRDAVALTRSGVSKKAHIEVNVLENAIIMGHSGQLRQVIINLITNAVEALPPEEGQIGVEIRETSLSRADVNGLHGSDLEPGTVYVLSVSDNGVGMNRQTQSRIFDPFFTTKATGRGLGLSATLGIVRSHGGAVRVKSKEHKGTVVEIMLPKAFGAVASGVEARVALINRGRILVVDDEPAVRVVAARILESHGYRVDVAESGRQGLDRFKARDGDFLCVLLDLSMPDMDGLELRAKLSALRPEVRVLIMSGFAEKSITDRLADEDSVAYVEKPFRAGSLLQAVEDLLSSNRQS